ncbi:uncharacterized protein BDZ99DRAFT_433042 [Mytilinidion resinicola]|uniref:Late sexual development protein n=1 Tax=Mytilinidion resinicola TaxID=574789 RepID=A0A6A6Z609_9PEZI|nr:uncharacterized protein BDZ99DRAFT_433042 [Mytilinidion resinicola]KAF2816103.1 hypothetical protein BDZ99DRAFT_433042 [Mytilinidion resinicola]
MRSVFSMAAVAGMALTSFVSAAPIESRDSPAFPLSDGFPNPSGAQILQIQQRAGGTLPNGKGAPPVSEDGLISLRLIALNELFEVAFFTELYQNLTTKVPGYDLGNGHQFILDAIEAVVAQEELHALNANGGLKANGAEPILPCKYSFPVSNFKDAIALAATFTDVVLGTLQDVQFKFAASGDINNVRGIGSVVGQEGEQEGFYRLLQSKKPSALPFLTTSVRDFAFTAIQGFTVPGSCPNIDTIKLTTFQPLTVLTTLSAQSTTAEFSFDKTKAGTDDYSTLSLVYINQQNVPIVEKLTVVGTYGNTVKVTAYFPYSEFELNGLTIAAIAKGNSFANADEVAKAAIFGPGLIEIN